MEAEVLRFLVGELAELLIGHLIKQLIQGQEVVRWIQYEFEDLIPLLERVEASHRLPKHIDAEFLRRFRDAIHRAEVLAETYTKTEIQRNAATVKTPIYVVRTMKISKQLHRIQREISGYTDRLERTLKNTADSEAQASTVQEQHSSVPSYLRRCLCYLLLFPPDFQVPARRLIALWVAEGLVRPKKNGNKSAEQIAERYLNELIDRQLLFCASRKRSGKVKACMMDEGRRNALMVKEAPHFLRDRDDKICRLVDSIDPSAGGGAECFIQVYGRNEEVFHPVWEYGSVISFLSLNTEEGNRPGEEIGGFLRLCISARCFIWLRVLDLERVFRPRLPNTLGKLLALKYLGLRWTYLEHLPDSVDKLFSLQVLDVKHTYISVLPRSIWRMQYLRHLYLSEAYLTRFPDPPSKVTLTALQTLWGAFVDEDTPVTRGLSKLLNLRKLGLSCRSRASKSDKMSQQLEAIDKWISKLEFLESLRLKSRDKSNEPDDLRLTSLEGNRKLSVVYLLGKLDRHILCKLPVSLTNVTLSGSELNLDPLEFLGRLPNLMILRLLSQSVVCSKMRCPGRGFRQLKVLWIWNMEKLEDFEAEEGSLPCLEELEIRSCKNLKALPRQLRHVLEIKLTSMPPEFMQREAGKYAKVKHVPNDDQYILTNTSTETVDLISSCFIGNEHSISRSRASGLIF